MSGSKIAVLVAALAIAVVGTIVAIGFALSNGSAPEETTAERVRLEIRGKPQASVKLDGNPIGKTPLSIYVKKSTKEITLDAVTEEYVMALGAKQRPITRQRAMQKKIVPDRDQLIDFVPPPMGIVPEAP